MYTQFFGNFLINKGIITTEQLMEALKIQASTHQKARYLGYTCRIHVSK